MPPQYKFYEPLPVTNYAGLPKELFNTPPVNFQADYNAALQDKQTLEGGQLALEQKQRQAAQEKAQAEAIAAQFGNMDPNAPVDMNKVWDVVQRTALQNNDIKTATDIERATRETGSKRLSPAIATRLGLPLETTEAEARLVGYKTHTDNVQARFDNPVQQLRRQYGAVKAYQEITGTKIRQPTNSQEEELKALSGLQGLASDIMERYLPHISENRAVRWGEININSNSAIARFKNELVQLTFSLAAAWNGKRISDADYKFMAPLLEPQPFDTLETVEDKVRRALDFADISKESLISTGEALGRNFQGLGTGKNSVPALDLLQVKPPQLSAPVESLAGQPQPSPSGPPAPQVSRWTPEQEARIQEMTKQKIAELRGQGL